DTVIKCYRDDATFEQSLNLQIPLIRQADDIPIFALDLSSDVEVMETVEFALGSIEPSQSIGRYSPSQVLTYLECPTKYYLRYQLGLPEDQHLPYFNEADTLAENVQGSLFGQVLHKVLERSARFISTEFIDMSLLSDVFAEVATELQLRDSERDLYYSRVEADIQTVYSSPIGRQALEAKVQDTEVALRASMPNGQLLSGIIDRLFLADDGVWNILDYKTDRRETDAKKARYQFQMQFYAYLVSRLHQTDVVKAHILYTSSGNVLSFMFTRKDFEASSDQLLILVNQIREQKKAESLESIARNLTHCPECPYFDNSIDLCIAGLGSSKTVASEEVTFFA
ncbi:MAG: PD-(D/E)XK nuclease family protein, partial [Ignavibacteriota bacterium]